MKVVLLAGGLGTRLREETAVKPKPMVSIGDHPILWHIMKIYAHSGYNEFVVALGYKGEVIKDYFLNYRLRSNSRLLVDLQTGGVELEASPVEDWKVHLLDTGFSTMTGGRVRRCQEIVGCAPFMVTYGDGVANLDINDLLRFHKSHGGLATLTAVRPPARFGALAFDGDRIDRFEEKPQVGEGWINGGFFVFEPAVFDYIKEDATVLEKEPLERLARDGQLFAYKHEGFWQCMDTLRDVQHLEKYWMENNAPWKVWN